MRFRTLVPITLASTVIAVVAGTITSRVLLKQPNSEPVSNTASVLFVPLDKLDFGRTWETTRFEWSFPVTNCGSGSLKVTGIATSCSCMSVTPDHFALDPGETITVTVAVDLTAKERPDSAASFVLTPHVELLSRVPHPHLEWVLKGKSEPLISVDRRPSFGRASVLDQPLKPVNLTVTTAIPVDMGLTAEADSPYIKARIFRDTMDVRKYHLELIAQKPLPLGLIKGKVILAPSSSHDKKLPISSLPFDALIVPDVECIPPAVLGGGHAIGATFTHSLTLSSFGNRPFHVLSATAEGKGMSIKRIGEEFLVTQHCQVTGQQNGKVVFQVEAADGRYAVTAVVSYVGVKD